MLQVCEVRKAGKDGRRPQYETVGLLGGLCEVSDFAAIIAASSSHDDYGIDTMTVGTLSLAMGVTKGSYRQEDT